MALFVYDCEMETPRGKMNHFYIERLSISEWKRLNKSIERIERGVIMDELKPHEDLCDFLNMCDDIGIKATIHYLKKHNFPYLEDRVKYEYSAGFGVARPLREVWIKLLDVNSLRFAEFYENIYRFRKVPRYEDLLIAVIISIASSLVADDLYERYRAWREKSKANDNLHNKFSSSAITLYEYLIRAYAVREAYIMGEVSYERFKRIKDSVKKSVFSDNLEEGDQVTEEDFNTLWDKFSEKHTSLDMVDLTNELREIIQLDLDKVDTSSQQQVKRVLRPAHSIIIQGLSGSPGVSYGTVKRIDSINDLPKILKGDIGVFRYYTPDMAQGLKRCVGAIGGAGSGGVTGHLAIVAREVGIPCVTLCDCEKLSDGQIVFLDGNNGEIRILLDIKEIKDILMEMK